MLAWLRALLLGENRMLAELLKVRITLNRLETTMATQDDINTLAARVDAATTAVKTGVGNIRGDIATLKATNPGVDTTALEASVAGLESEVSDVTELDSENPASTTTP
jgi:hypothetical protein